MRQGRQLGDRQVHHPIGLLAAEVGHAPLGPVERVEGDADAAEHALGDAGVLCLGAGAGAARTHAHTVAD